MKAEEAVDALATNVFSNRPFFRPTQRTPVTDEVARYCSSLIAVDTVEYYDLAPIPEDLKPKSDLFGQDHTTTIRVKELRLAHMTVRDYMMSKTAEEEVRNHMDASTAKSYIAHISLCYILSLDHTLAAWEIARAYPLALWASKHWWMHAKVGEQHESTRKMIVELLANHSAYRTWRLLYSPEIHKELASEVAHMDYLTQRKSSRTADHAQRKSSRTAEHAQEVIPPLLTAINGSLDLTLRDLLSYSVDEPMQIFRSILDPQKAESFSPAYHELINGLQFIPTALFKAAEVGDTSVVRALLEGGAGAHQPVSIHGSPLSVACYHGHVATVKLLLECGGGPRIRQFAIEQYSVRLALQKAISRNHKHIIKLVVNAISFDHLFDLTTDPPFYHCNINMHIRFFDTQDEDGKTPLDRLEEAQSNGQLSSLESYEVTKAYLEGHQWLLKRQRLQTHQVFLERNLHCFQNSPQLFQEDLQWAQEEHQRVQKDLKWLQEDEKWLQEDRKRLEEDRKRLREKYHRV